MDFFLIVYSFLDEFVLASVVNGIFLEVVSDFIVSDLFIEDSFLPIASLIVCLSLFLPDDDNLDVDFDLCILIVINYYKFIKHLKGIFYYLTVSAIFDLNVKI